MTSINNIRSIASDTAVAEVKKRLPRVVTIPSVNDTHEEIFRLTPPDYSAGIVEVKAIGLASDGESAIIVKMFSYIKSTTADSVTETELVRVTTLSFVSADVEGTTDAGDVVVSVVGIDGYSIEWKVSFTHLNLVNEVLP